MQIMYVVVFCLVNKRVLSWFSVFESAKNMKYAWDGSFIQVSMPKSIHIEHGLTRVIEKIKRVPFFCPAVRMLMVTMVQ